jgi:hypothetical protein
MICFYALRAGYRQELALYLSDYNYLDDDLISFMQLIGQEQQAMILSQDKFDFSLKGGFVNDFKANLQNLFKKDKEINMQQSLTVWDVIWFYNFKNNIFFYEEDQRTPIDFLRKNIALNTEIGGNSENYKENQKQMIMLFC